MAVDNNHRMKKLSKEINVIVGKVSKIMTRQCEIYQEMIVRYKALNRPKMCLALDTVKIGRASCRERVYVLV